MQGPGLAVAGGRREHRLRRRKVVGTEGGRGRTLKMTTEHWIWKGKAMFSSMMKSSTTCDDN